MNENYYNLYQNQYITKFVIKKLFSSLQGLQPHITIFILQKHLIIYRKTNIGVITV